MKITEKVFKIECTKGAYAYAIRTTEGITLIDTSLPGRSDRILKELEIYGIKANEIRRILLTHHDIDHIGNIKVLADKSGCDVYVSAVDLPYVIGQKQRDGIKKLFAIMMKVEIPKSLSAFSGDSIGEFQIIPTPGHTRGHCCFKFENILFAGDLVSEKNGTISSAPKLMTWDMPLLIASAKSIDMNGIEWICPAHGEPITVDRWQDFIESIH